MRTIDDVIDTIRAATDEHEAAPLRVNDLEWQLYRSLGGEALGVDADQWRALVGHVRIALSSDEHALEIPEPAAVIAAAVLLDIPGEAVASLIEDIDQEVYTSRDRVGRARVDAAYYQAGRLVTSLHSLLFVVTTIRPRTIAHQTPVRTLVEANDMRLLARDQAEQAQAAFADAVRAAVAGGISQVEITRVTGLSKQRISKIVAGRGE